MCRLCLQSKAVSLQGHGQAVLVKDAHRSIISVNMGPERVSNTVEISPGTPKNTYNAERE